MVQAGGSYIRPASSWKGCNINLHIDLMLGRGLCTSLSDLSAALASDWTSLANSFSGSQSSPARASSMDGSCWKWQHGVRPRMRKKVIFFGEQESLTFIHCEDLKGSECEWFLDVRGFWNLANISCEISSSIGCFPCTFHSLFGKGLLIYQQGGFPCMLSRHHLWQKYDPELLHHQPWRKLLGWPKSKSTLTDYLLAQHKALPLPEASHFSNLYLWKIRIPSPAAHGNPRESKQLSRLFWTRVPLPARCRRVPHPAQPPPLHATALLHGNHGMKSLG